MAKVNSGWLRHLKVKGRVTGYALSIRIPPGNRVTGYLGRFSRDDDIYPGGSSPKIADRVSYPSGPRSRVSTGPASCRRLSLHQQYL
jgi:hypothetical protein